MCQTTSYLGGLREMNQTRDHIHVLILWRETRYSPHEAQPRAVELPQISMHFIPS